MTELKDTFSNPGPAYRGKPFWAWNGVLDAEELRRQVRVMHQMGLGGFFMHSRVGLGTPYLSEEWFRMIRACVEEARRLDMEAWLYDEDRWPSGAAGGLVTSDPAYQHRNLHMVACRPEEADFDEEPLALFSARVDGVTVTDLQRLPEDWDGGVEPEDALLLAFFVRRDEPSSWFNDATYLDTMSHEAVEKFIEVTHEAYRREVGEEFDGVIPGVFTDEPHHGRVYAGDWAENGTSSVPWTDRLPEVFRERYGYDILDYLPHIFLNVDGEEISRPRWHYHDCKTFLFVDAFGRLIFEWCEENSLSLTGHVLAESTLRSQAGVGGSAMRFYEYMQAPGIDQLTDCWREYTTAKQCASVQHQMGRRWMLSELYGCTGWDWPFEGHKAVGDWQAVLGVNLRCQHLSWYTMAGQAKRDYPASILHQSPWWRHYSKVEDYFGRVNTLMSRGEPVRGLLVIHPVESCWARATVKWHDDPEIDRLEEEFDALINWLLEAHLDFDYGDEDIMSRHGGTEGGATPALIVGEAAYDAVLVPPVDTLRASTVDLLEDFAEAGGLIVFAGAAPGRVDAEKSDRADKLADRCRCVPFERGPVLEAVEPGRTLSVRDGSGQEKAEVFYRLHREGERRFLFLINTDRENPTGPLTLCLPGEGAVQLWDAETGRRFSVDAETTEEGLNFTTEMPPTGSRLFVIDPEAEELPAVPALKETRSVELPEDAWTAELTDYNVLVLDRPEYRVGDGEWQGPLEVLRADREIREAAGLPPRSGRMVQPWARPQKTGPTASVGLRYRFGADDRPPGPLFLALENPEYFEISLNGAPVPTEGEFGWWVDKAIRLLPLDEAALLAGENELLLTAQMDRDCDLEACFLLGEFAVAVDGAEASIQGPPGNVALGDWRGQGLPFYSGSVVLRADVRVSPGADERLFVEVPEFGGACVRVLVDGREAGVIGWQPHEVEITDLVSGKEEAELALEVVSHRRNAFGPLHHTSDDLDFVGPGSFVSGGDDWQEEYNLVPTGCLAPPRLSVREG